MSLHDILITVQYISVAAVLLESFIVFRNWKSMLHSYLFISCIATLANNLGYLMELKAGTYEAFIMAVKFSYLGRVWITLSLLFFVAELCHVRLPDIFRYLSGFVSLLIYFVILTLEDHDLYYTDVSFDANGIFPVFLHGNGIIHHVFMILQCFYIVLGITILLLTLKKEKKKIARKRLQAVIFAVIVESLFFLLRTLGICRIYDLTMPGYVIGAVIIMTAIFRYDLLGTRDIAREFMIDRLSEGIIAVDNEGDMQYYNDPAKKLFPDLTEAPGKTIQEIRNAINRGEPLEIEERIYTPEENDLLYKGESFGKLYVLVDSTEHYKRLKKEKKLLRKELLTDPLTGFYNRKGMEHYARKMYNEILESHRALFLCVADMNGLKYINDNFGHEQGDIAIKTLAAMIRESLLQGDMAFRTGGDEFLIMGARDNRHDAEKDYSERIEEIIGRYNSKSGLPYKIDMSYGPLVTFPGGYEDELDRLIKQSDTIMYEMKKRRDEHRR